jgi:5'-3' exonuclease
MGIPSFYRHLCRKYPKIIGTGTGSKTKWLCLDFNCAMYFVLRQMRPFDATAPHAWEEEFCEAIAAYMREIVAVAAPTVGVYVSCDGVVCAAKRRQQRLRRFKGPWLSAAERAVTEVVAATETETESWDQNALTPGSAFMARLGAHLITAGAALSKKTGLQVVVSTTAEPGEGEHKLMAHMRRVRPESCTIYGLDADLILLAMLLTVDTGGAVNLLREAQEFEGRGAGWRTLDIGALVSALGLTGSPQIRDFVAAMTLLGNDFLPRSLTRTVRDDGIPQLLATLRSLWAAGRTLVDERGIRREALLAILGTWAATEEADMLTAIQNAQRAATTPASAATPTETALKEWQAGPARWCSVARLLGPKETLASRWRDVYRGAWHAGAPSAYIAGLAWTWDYYSGRPVCQGWSFDEHLPPLWSDVSAYLKEISVDRIAAPPIVWPTSLPEWVHLLSVLPVASVERLLPLARRQLVKERPWYWPASWSLFDIGRSLMWECEAVIPQIPESVLRSLKI